MVYRWEEHRATCLDLYIHQGRTLDEIMQYFKANHGFTPSARAFQQQFQRWGFPAKHEPAWKNPVLVRRVKQLWERNLSQKEMLRVLFKEGFPLNEKELGTLRKKNGWKMRTSRLDTPPMTLFAEPSPEPSHDSIDQLLDRLSRDAHGLDPVDGHETHLIQDYAGHHLAYLGDLLTVPSPSQSPSQSPSESPRGARAIGPAPPGSRKRRRYRMDASGAISRFPCEMTLDEARGALRLDNARYAEVRERFQQICEVEGVTKKSLAGPEKWDDLVAHLIRTTPALSSTRQRRRQTGGPSPAEPPRELQALDVICTDVTKRMRTAEKRISMAGARTALGLNPQEAREVRARFEEVLGESGFSTDSRIGDLDWDELSRRWADKSERVRAVLLGEPCADRASRLRLLQFVARDVIKRIKDQARKSAKTRGSSIEEAEAEAEGHLLSAGRGHDGVVAATAAAAVAAAIATSAGVAAPLEHLEHLEHHSQDAAAGIDDMDPSAWAQGLVPSNPSGHHLPVHVHVGGSGIDGHQQHQQQHLVTDAEMAKMNAAEWPFSDESLHHQPYPMLLSDYQLLFWDHDGHFFPQA